MGHTKIVCFDLGGVLVRVAHSWNEALRHAGLPSPAAVVGLSEVEGFDAYQEGSWTLERYLDSVAATFGITAEEAKLAHQSILIGEYDGALALVQDLNAAGIHTACLSNTNDLHWQRLLDPQFHPAVVALQWPMASHILGLAKPDPAIYRAAEAALGGTPVFFDDNTANIQVAKQVGWNAHQTDPAGDPPAMMRAVLEAAGFLSGSLVG